jgi:hypothetical protein
MTLDGRLIETDPVALGTWKRLTRLFATWNLILFGTFSKRAWLFLANDHMTPMLEVTHWKLGLGLLGGLTDKQILFLKAYSELNAARADRGFRMLALLLVTIPVGTIIGLNEISPLIWDQLGFRQVESLIFVGLIWLLVAGIMMAASWRARDMADLITFELARRRTDPDPDTHQRTGS